MRIRDWSSDVCSSDVEEGGALEQLRPATGVGCVVAQHPRADRIGPLRGPALAARVLAVDAPAGEQLHVRRRFRAPCEQLRDRSEEHQSELQSLMRNSYSVFCLKQKKGQQEN